MTEIFLILKPYDVSVKFYCGSIWEKVKVSIYRKRERERERERELVRKAKEQRDK